LQTTIEVAEGAGHRRVQLSKRGCRGSLNLYAKAATETTISLGKGEFFLRGRVRTKPGWKVGGGDVRFCSALELVTNERHLQFGNWTEQSVKIVEDSFEPDQEGWVIAALHGSHKYSIYSIGVFYAPAMSPEVKEHKQGFHGIPHPE